MLETCSKRERVALLAEAAVLFMKRWFIENSLQMAVMHRRKGAGGGRKEGKHGN